MRAYGFSDAFASLEPASSHAGSATMAIAAAKSTKKTQASCAPSLRSLRAQGLSAEAIWAQAGLPPLP